MDGKRNWRIVSWYLRQAARGKFAKGKPLATRLYVPETFNVEKKTEIAARRRSAWAPIQQHGAGQQFMMLIGEYKDIVPARFGHKLLVKHLPDAPLMIDDTLLARLNKRFSDELELAQADDDGHLMVIATFSVGRAGLATAEEISLVMTDEHWLPYESLFDKLLLDAALAAGSPSRCATTSLPTSPWPPWCSPTPRPLPRRSCSPAGRSATPPPRSPPTPAPRSGRGSSAKTCRRSRPSLTLGTPRTIATTERRHGLPSTEPPGPREVGDPRYILDLLARVVTVSLETRAIVDSLPLLEIRDQQ